jgi:PAS domain S-box-containing protein
MSDMTVQFALWQVLVIGGLGATVTVGAAVVSRLQDRALAAATRRSSAVREATLRASLEAIVTIDRHSRIVEWNEVATQIFGHNREAVLGASITGLIIPPVHRAGHDRGMAHFLTTGEGPVLGRRLEIPALHRDGHEFPIEIAISTIDVDDGPLFTAYIRDITDRKRAERELRESQERYLTLFQASADAIIVHGLDGVIVDVNEAALEKFGYTREAFLALRVPALHPPHELPNARHAFEAVRDASRAIMEMEFQRADGTCFPAELRARVFESNGQRLVHGVVRNIEERRRAEAELRLAAQAFEATGPAAITDREGRVIRVNGAFAQMTGYSAVDAIGHSPLWFTREGEDATRCARIWEAARERGEWRAETTAWRASGERFAQFIVISAVRDADGDISHFVASFTDISERKRNEAALKLARKHAEDANEAKSRFLATVSHEIRSPLNAVINMNELLLETSLDAAQRDLAEIATAGGRTLMALLDNVLDFSRIEAGELALHCKPFDLVATVEETVELMSTRAKAEAPLSLVVAPGVPLEVTGDSLRVRQVLLNLISNAIKFTEQGGVTLRLKPAPEARGVRLEVEDTGIGIPRDKQRAIFGEFIQADSSDSRRFGGTGLGLSIVRRLVELMGGTIAVQSEVGAGSLFTVDLPLAAGGAQARSGHVLTRPDAATLPHVVLLGGFKNLVMRAAVAEQLTLHGICWELSDRWTDGGRHTPCGNARRPRGLLLWGDPEDAAGARQRLAELRGASRDCAWQGVLLAPRTVRPARHADSAGLGIVSCPLRVSELPRLLGIDEEDTARVPDQPSTPESAAPPASAPGRAAGLSVLLVEDSPANQAVAQTVLAREGYAVTVAANGLQAVDRAATASFDVILMDLAMPIMDGLEATRRIRMTGHRNALTPIIALTANAFGEDRERCYAAGMNDYLPKPLDAKRFRERVWHWANEAPAEAELERTGHLSRPPDPDTLVNRTVLRQLALDTSPEVLPNIVQLFEQETRERVPRMRKYADTGDLGCLADEAHTLKSAAGSFGLLRLQALAREIELRGREGQLHNAREAVGTLSTVCDLSLQRLVQAVTVLDADAEPHDYRR